MTLTGSTDSPCISPDEERPLRVCYFGAYRASYVRNRLLIEGLRRNGVDVVECHEPLWRGIEDRVDAVKGKWKSPAFFWRVLSTYARLLGKYFALKRDYDVMVLGYPGQFDVFLARLLTWLRGRPLAWDILMSIYLVAVERDLHRHGPWIVRAIRMVEACATRLPDLLVMDTEEYCLWFERNYGVERERFRLLPIGVDSDVFTQEAAMAANADRLISSSRRFRVLYYGTFIENHGVDTIVRAARLLSEHRDIEFELIGDGPQRARAEFLTKRYGLPNVQMEGWLSSEELREHIASADLCLGVFGTTPQSMITVHNKLKECMAMGKPVLSGDSPAVRDEFCDGEHIFLCRRADPTALAAAIVQLQQQPELRARVGRQAAQLMNLDYAIEANGRRLKEHLLALTVRQKVVK